MNDVPYFSYFKLSCWTLRATWRLVMGRIWPTGRFYAPLFYNVPTTYRDIGKSMYSLLICFLSSAPPYINIAGQAH